MQLVELCLATTKGIPTPYRFGLSERQSYRQILKRLSEKIIKSQYFSAPVKLSFRR